LPGQEVNAAPGGRWTQETREGVERRQREAYRSLGSKLGISGEPLEIQRKMFRSMTPPEPQPVDLSRLPGYSSFTPDELKQFYEGVENSYLNALKMQLPTPYEDPLRYPILLKTFNSVYEAMRREGRLVEPQPLLATLPLGDVNATMEGIPHTKARVMYLDQGLVQFIVDFAATITWAIPSLGHQELSDEAAMARLPNRYTMPPEASSFFAASIFSYTLSGTPVTESSPIRAPDFNHFACVTLTVHMLRFVIAHELRHAEADDRAYYGKSEANRGREYDADRSAAALVCKMAREEQCSGVVGYWACDLLLCLYNILYRAMAVLKFGTVKLRWINADYPDPLSRRNRLRENAESEVLIETSPITLGVVDQLRSMTEAIIGRLWEMSNWMLVQQNQAGARPSPIWAEQLARSIGTSEV
jgi:hypothetical protein